ncbi:MAG: FAD-dependent oxidoreductase, partial [Caldilineaceae bacterium]|nr:FAD-dependent oxidoreductase [Caldilineaceae bacterium]
MTRNSATGFSRRAFIQSASSLGAASLLAGCIPATHALAESDEAYASTTPTESIDVAIIGAGVSGVYSAWRLKQADPSRNVVVFEGSDRIGGRLLSVRPPDIPNMVAELGGMRILPAVQPRIVHLLDMLNQALPDDQQIETYDFPVDEAQNMLYLRGVHLRLADFSDAPEKVPYHLSFLESGKSAGGLIVEAIEQIAPGITNPALDEAQRRAMVREASFDGLPLYRQGFWNVLARVMTSEAYQLVVDAGGYSSIVYNWNAADAIPWFLADFGVAPAYKGFKKGFQAVPLALADLFQRAGGELRLGSPLHGFEAANDGFALQFQEDSIHADALILAMPRRSLELLTPSSPLLQEIEGLIKSVTAQPLFKIFTTYANPWWRSTGYTTADGAY